MKNYRKNPIPPGEDRFTPGQDLKNYVENRIELFSLAIAEQIAEAISDSVQKFVGLIFLSAGILFAWIALGFFLGELLNSQALGFLIASLPLLIIGSVLFKRTSSNLNAKIQSDIIGKVAIQFESEDETDTSEKRIRREEQLEQR